MSNNAEIRIEAGMNNLEKFLNRVREMSTEQIEDFEKELKAKSKIVNDRIYLVSLLSGREIGDKAYKNAIDMMVDEMKEAMEDGYNFDSREIPAIDPKTGKPVMRTVWSDKNAAGCREAVKGVISDELYDQIDRRLNKYEMRREHGIAKRDTLNSMRHAINTVKREIREKDHEAKKTKLIPLAVLGKQMMAGMQVQPVREITA
ncbi:MAG: hypothetical protein PHP08_00915 [Candidatus Dojkabacteria bacterium]|nr:hypothetical protein [Candidatus Dojkabacteria bacterium]